MGFGSEIRDPGVKKATLLVSELCISHLSISHTISLVHLSPVICVNKYLYTVCVGGGGLWGHRRGGDLRHIKVLLQVTFLDDDILLWSLNS